MGDAGLIPDLASALARHGMILRGGFLLSDADEQDLAAFPDLVGNGGERTLLLVGNAGPALYHAFFGAMGERPRRGLNPLDDWTRDAIAPITDTFGARAAFPFGGPPWLPFQRWAKRAEGLQASPLGVLIHPEYGLWHAYRAALLFDRRLDLPAPAAPILPCDTCTARPCLSACPVSAFTAQGYAVDPCARHVASAEGAACRTAGCLARRACPVGVGYAYPQAALAFHMAAFLAGRNGGEGFG